MPNREFVPSFPASVIIPTYQREELLRLSLNSLAAQDDLSQFEVIVCDDGSSDRTFDVVVSFERKLAIRYAYQPDEGYGTTAARNMGIRLARGDISIFLDCGNLVCSTFVRQHLNAHRVPRAAVIGYIWGFDYDADNAPEVMAKLAPDDIDRTIAMMKATPALLDIRERCYLACKDDLSKIGAAWALFWGGNISVSTSRARNVAGFDECFRTWGLDDIEFGLRLYQHGARFLLQRSAAAVQYPHPKDRDAREVSYMNNMRYIYEKHGLEEVKPILQNGETHMGMILSSIDQ